MDTKRVALVLSVVALGIAPMAMATPACSVRAKIPAAARIFARTTNQTTWREFRSLQEVPELRLDSGMSAAFWHDKNRSRSVYIVEPGQDFWTYTRYCFDGGGELEGVGFEIRTTLGWGHRAQGSVSSGEFDASTSEFFRTKDGKPISKPAGVRDVPAALKPTLYRNVTELPFAPLLTAPDHRKHHRK